MNEPRDLQIGGRTATGCVSSVAELTSRIRQSLQQEFSSIWVAGEISDLTRPRSGHVYLTLKDDQAQIRAVIWRNAAEHLKIPLTDGLKVACFGSLDVYPPRGNYQLIVKQLEPLGEGAVQRALRQLQARLAAEGLFDERHKKPLPLFPQRILVVTSPTGAALHDFLEVAQRRWKGPEIWIVPTAVQGETAKDEICAALKFSNLLQPAPDVIVLTRGGGSIEDLWSFNEESVVRAIFASRIPVVSAVGHEIDVTLADLVADCRALTPSEAAERVIPSSDEIRARLIYSQRRIVNLATNQLRALRSRVDALAQRPALARPWDRLRELQLRLDDWDTRLARGLRFCHQRSHDRADHFAARLHALSPLAVLERGYSLTTLADSGTIVRRAAQVRPGSRVNTRLFDGEFVSVVE